jgi:Flp pilus assembly protein TadB
VLSDDDRHALAAIERRLLADDPALAHRWAATAANGSMKMAASDTTQRCHYAGVIALSLMLLTAGVALHLPVTTALCAVVALATLVLHARRHEHHGPGPRAG